MASKSQKRMLAKQRHVNQKMRAKMNNIFIHVAVPNKLSSDERNAELFNNIISKVEKLNLKQLKFLSEEIIIKEYNYPVHGENRRVLLATIESLILERTVLA